MCTAPLSVVYILSVFLPCWRINVFNTGEPPKLELCSLGMGGEADPSQGVRTVGRQTVGRKTFGRHGRDDWLTALGDKGCMQK